MSWFSDFYSKLLGSGPSYKKNPKETKSFSDYSYVSPIVEINIFLSESLLARNGRYADKTAARYVSRALSNAGYSNKITYNFPVLNPPSETDTRETLGWLAHDSGITKAKDSNMLLLNRNGGGRAFVGAKAGVVGARHVETDREWQSQGEDDEIRCLAALLHEIGHNLGAHHDHDDGKEGAQHWGMGWNQNGKWHRTPCVGGNGAENVCGEYIPEREYRAVRYHMNYNACAAENFKVRDLE